MKLVFYRDGKVAEDQEGYVLAADGQIWYTSCWHLCWDALETIEDGSATVKLKEETDA